MMFFRQSSQRFFLMATLILSPGHLIATEQIQEEESFLRGFGSLLQKCYVKNCQNETSIELEGLNVTELPPEFGDPTKIVWLSMANQKLKELPFEIGTLINLQNLDLHNNELTELPPQIGKLTNLQQLRLRMNNITELPPEMGNLAKLVKLHIDPEVNSGFEYVLALFDHKLSLIRIGDKLYQKKEEVERYIESQKGAMIKGAMT